MRLLPAITTLVLGLSAPVWAGESSIWWPGWTISSTEDFSAINNGEKPFPHPLSALFDANPKTAWVMNPQATSTEMYLSESESVEKLFGKTKRGLLISTQSRSQKGSAQGRWLSGLQIMNGDNRSKRAFAGGNRIRTLRVTLLDGKRRHGYTLPLQNRMGWQRVSWPRQRADKVAIEFAELGDAKKPVCASGLGLLDGAREIKWNMPQAVLFYDGLEGEGAIMLLNRRGEVIDGLATDDGESGEWSSDGRFVAGINGGGGIKPYLWIADAKKGKIIRKIYPRTSQEDLSFEWISAQQMKVEFLRHTKKSDGAYKPFQTKIYRF